MKTDDELRAAHHYYVSVRPDVEFNIVGDPYFYYYGECYYVAEIEDFADREGLPMIATAKRSVKLPKF